MSVKRLWSSNSISILWAVIGVFVAVALDQALGVPTNVDTKIVGGTIVPRGQTIPYQLSLRSRGHHTCGGVIMNATAALTAAHCVRGSRAADLTVVAGGYDLLHMEPHEQMLQVKSIRIHPLYNPDTQENDIAMLVIGGQGFKFNRYVDKARMPGPLIPEFKGFPAVASGWGKTSPTGPISNVLQTVELSIIGRDECRQVYGRKIKDTMLCAHAGGGRDTCQGDSGGPLVIHSTYKGVSGPVLVGITSWGHGCGHRKYPGVYVQVNKFFDWINKETHGFNFGMPLIPSISLDGLKTAISNKISEKIEERKLKWFDRLERFGRSLLGFFTG